MTLRHIKDPHPLAPDDPGLQAGLQGENHALGMRRSTARFGEALKRAGHVMVAPDRASMEAREHLLAVLAEQRRR